MDKLVEENLNIQNNNDISTFATLTTLNGGSFDGTIGGPITPPPGDFKMIIYWSQSTISGVTNRTLITAEMYFYHRYEWTGSVKANGETFINIDGLSKSLRADVDVTGGPGYYYIMSTTLEVPESTVSIQMAGRCDVDDSTYNGTVWNGVEGRANLYLNNPENPIYPPTTVSVNGKYEIGKQVSVSWSGATGNIEYYEIEYDMFTNDNDWLGWEYIGYSETLSKIHTINSISGKKIKYRIRSRNSSSASAWKESTDYAYHYGIKVNNNGFSYGTLKVWNGTSWVPGSTKVWNGTEWIYTL